MQKPANPFLGIKNQYLGYSLKDIEDAQKAGRSMTYDGLPVKFPQYLLCILLFTDLTQMDTLLDYQVMVQDLCAVHHPRVPSRDVRHPSIDPTSLDAYVMRYKVGNKEYAERRGVLHLSHAWTQKGHNDLVSLYLIILSCLLNCLLVDDVPGFHSWMSCRRRRSSLL